MDSAFSLRGAPDRKGPLTEMGNREEETLIELETEWLQLAEVRVALMKPDIIPKLQSWQNLP